MTRILLTLILFLLAAPVQATPILIPEPDFDRVEIVISDPVITERWTLHVFFNEPGAEANALAFSELDPTGEGLSPYDYVLPYGYLMSAWWIGYPPIGCCGCGGGEATVPEPETIILLLIGTMVVINSNMYEEERIIPIAAFNFEDPQDFDFKKCWSLGNLQLLEISKNASKGAKLEKPFQPSLSLYAGKTRVWTR